MSTTTRHSLAIVGAGPVGLEAAALAATAGLDVHVFERGEAGAHPIAWGHVRMEQPWRALTGAGGRALLDAEGWSAPDADAMPTGAEFAERYLQPLARTQALRARVHEHSQVVYAGRRGHSRRGATDAATRGDAAFRLLVRDAGGRENFLHAHALADASGVYGSPQFAGSGGIPARNELYLTPQLAYRLEDVRGLRRERHAGKRTLVIGGGATAATNVLDLVQLAHEHPGTTVLWVTRATAPGVANRSADDALVRAALPLQSGAEPACTWAGGAVLESLEYNSGTHRYRAQFLVGDQARVEEVDQVIVNTGFTPDEQVLRALDLALCPHTRAPLGVAAALARGDAAGTATLAALAHPEPNVWVIGAKSYGNAPGHTLATGYAQAAALVAHLAASTTATR